jgi:hypothetical protein
MRHPAILMTVGCLLLLSPDHAAGMGRPTKLEQMRQIAKKLDVPIVFYGVVTDDGGAPVSNAQVQVHYAHFALNYGGGIDTKEETTDEAGRFTVSGIRGRELYLNKIYRLGYEFTYTGSTFPYSGSPPDKIHVPDKNNPVRFTLRKKNPPTLVLPRKHAKQFNDTVRTVYYDSQRRELWTRQFNGEVRLDDLAVSAVRDPEKMTWTVIFETVRPEDGIVLSKDKVYSVPSDGLQSRLTVLVPEGPPGQPFHLCLKARFGTIFTGFDGILYAWPNLLNFNFDTRSNLNNDPNIDFYEEVFRDYLATTEAEKEREREERRKKLAQ